MAHPLVVRLLGPPQFSIAASVLACPSKKSLALFVFVLLGGKTHSRRDLATLLWGQRDEESARASLRAALHRLPAAMADCLQVERDSVGVAPAAAPLVDVARFEVLARSRELDSLEKAATLYSDELLKDFEPVATPEFDDWLHAERVRLAQLAQSVFDGVIAQRSDRARRDTARATSERESALATGLRWIALMPGSEAGHRWLMRLYLDMGRRDAALAQFELCQRSLAVLHGRPPSPETRALHEMALAGDAQGQLAPSAADPPRGADFASLPDAEAVAATSFVGRLGELAELDRLFEDPSCRLITLHGLGGAGKTRLAHAFASQMAARFAQGVSWVSLDASASSNALPEAIAQALGRDLPAGQDPAGALAGMLARQQRLLVLDNFESLLNDDAHATDADPRAVVLKILQAAPRVRIVVTSREVLGLQEEWVFDVHGLSEAADEFSEAASVHPPAIALFDQRAGQAYLGFSLDAELPHVVRICKLVEGLPLGIEIAAAWVRTIPCADIAAAIESEAGALASRHRNRPGRHRSLEAVVACSWRLLGDDQRVALAGLGIFVGGFTRDAAERIADAPLRMLSALADKALVRRRTEGRYDLHELVRQFALARLRQSRGRHSAASTRHDAYFSTMLLRVFDDLHSPAEVAADALFRSELPNMLAAWRRAIDARAAATIERMAAPMIALLHTRGLLPMALTEAERAVDALGNRASVTAMAMVHMQWGRAAISGGKRDLARRELDEALGAARRSGSDDLTARCLAYRAALAYQQGDLDTAESLADEAMALGATSSSSEVRMLVHNTRGSVANLRSQFDMAQVLLSKGLAAARELGAPSRIGGMLCSVAVPFYYQGQFAEAAALTGEAARLYEMLGRNATAITVRGNLAAIALAQGDLPAALEQATIAVRLARESGDDNGLAETLATLGDIHFRQGDIEVARTSAAECLQMAQSLAKPLVITEARYLLARMEMHEGRSAAALTHILSLRDVLVEHRLAVRVPMLVLAAAQWAIAGNTDDRHLARCWLHSLARLEDVDATLRERARSLLARTGDTPGSAPIDEGAVISLPEIEGYALAFLDRVVQ